MELVTRHRDGKNCVKPYRNGRCWGQDWHVVAPEHARDKHHYIIQRAALITSKTRNAKYWSCTGQRQLVRWPPQLSNEVPSPIIICNITPRFHNRDSEYCLLSEEQNRVQMNPQQFLYYIHLSPSPYLATSSEVALTMHLLSLVFINSFRNMSLKLSSSVLAPSLQFVVTHRLRSTEHSAVGFSPENGLHTVCTFLKTYCLLNCGVQGTLGSSNSVDRHFSDLRSTAWHKYVSQ